MVAAFGEVEGLEEGRAWTSAAGRAVPRSGRPVGLPSSPRRAGVRPARRRPRCCRPQPGPGGSPPRVARSARHGLRRGSGAASSEPRLGDHRDPADRRAGGSSSSNRDADLMQGALRLPRACSPWAEVDAKVAASISWAAPGLCSPSDQVDVDRPSTGSTWMPITVWVVDGPRRNPSSALREEFATSVTIGAGNAPPRDARGSASRSMYGSADRR